MQTAASLQEGQPGGWTDGLRRSRWQVLGVACGVWHTAAVVVEHEGPLAQGLAQSLGGTPVKGTEAAGLAAAAGAGGGEGTPRPEASALSGGGGPHHRRNSSASSVFSEVGWPRMSLPVLLLLLAICSLHCIGLRLLQVSLLTLFPRSQHRVAGRAGWAAPRHSLQAQPSSPLSRLPCRAMAAMHALLADFTQVSFFHEGLGGTLYTWGGVNESVVFGSRSESLLGKIALRLHSKAALCRSQGLGQQARLLAWPGHLCYRAQGVR